ncbi:MAG: hypothetical protein JXA20_13100 [Spirochaetes bacterium]|nr:hypothetical protein [Spirochaetota bacterium]
MRYSVETDRPVRRGAATPRFTPRHLALLAACLLAVFRAGPLFASAVSMGRVESVSSDYALDSVRNPALLTGRSVGVSFSLIAIYRPMFLDTDNSVLRTASSIIAYPINSSNSSYTAAQLFAGFLWNSGESAFGVGVGSTGKGQYMESRDDLTVGQYLSTTHTTSVNPALYLSYSLRLSGRDSVGIQAMSAYSNTVDRQREFNSSVPQVTRSETSASALVTAVTAGFRHRMDRAEIGVMLRSGQLAAEWITASAEYFAASSTRDDYSHPARLMYIQGPGLVAGVNAVITDSLGACMEMEITAPVVFRRKMPAFIGTVGFYFDEFHRYRRDTAVTLRGGLEFSPNSWTNLNLGGGVAYGNGKSKGEVFDSRRIEQGIFTCYATLGMDYRFTERMAVIVGVSYIMTRTSIEMMIYDSTPFKFDIDTKTNAIDVYLGVSLGL